jgi:hypothetical protein
MSGTTQLSQKKPKIGSDFQICTSNK